MRTCVVREVNPCLCSYTSADYSQANATLKTTVTRHGMSLHIIMHYEPLKMGPGLNSLSMKVFPTTYRR